MKLSEFKGEKALDVLAELIEPVVELCGDENIAKRLRTKDKLGAIKIALKEHKKAVISILAILDEKDPNEYEVNILTLPIKLLEVLNDPEIVQLFFSSSQSVDGTPSGSASETAE